MWYSSSSGDGGGGGGSSCSGSGGGSSSTRSGELLKYLVIFQDIKKFPVFYGTPTC